MRTTSEPGSADGWLARPAMKQPPAFRMGEPSYLMPASTPGNDSPTAFTVSNLADGLAGTHRYYDAPHGSTTSAHRRGVVPPVDNPRNWSVVDRAYARRAGSGRRAGAALRGRSDVAPADAKPLAAGQRHWRLGRRPGSRVDRAPRVRHAGQQREGPRVEVGRVLLRGRATRARVRRAGQSGAALGWARSGIRLARVESWHLRRPHRQRLDWRQRPRRFACRQVHQGRQIPGAIRQAQRAHE